MGHEIEKRVVEEDVKFVCLQFTDVTGAVKSVDIPAGQLGRALEDGVWFDGSSVEGFARIQESDMRLILDPETFAVLPWSQPERRRARVFCDIYRPDGTPFPGDPRGVPPPSPDGVRAADLGKGERNLLRPPAASADRSIFPGDFPG